MTGQGQNQKTKSMVYKHGLPFSEKLGENIIDGVDRVKRKLATAIVIDGGVGQGKTTIAVQVADFINELFDLDVISLDIKYHPQLAMGGKQFASQMRECFIKGLPAIVYDEAGDFSKRGSMTQFNAFLNRIFETYRAFKIIVIIVVPNMYVLDNNLFDNQIPRFLLHCHGRTESQGNFSGYSLYNMFKIRYLMSKTTNKAYPYTINDLKNFVGHFKDLDPERSKALDKLTISSKLDILQSAELHLEGLIDRADIGRRLAKSQSWVKLACMKLKINPKRYVKRVAYYDKNVIDILQDFIMNGGVVTGVGYKKSKGGAHEKK